MNLKITALIFAMLLCFGIKAQQSNTIITTLRVDTLQGTKVVNGNSILSTSFITLKDTLATKVIIMSDTNIIYSSNGFISFGGNGIRFTPKTNAELSLIVAPKIGDAILNTDKKRLLVFDGVNWITF